MAEFEQLIINEIDVNDFVVVEPTKEVQAPAVTPIVAKEIVPEVQEEAEFVINKITELPAEVVVEEQDQMLMFDLPMHSAPEETVSQFEMQEEEVEVMTTSISEIEVTDPIQVVPVDEISKDGVKRYSLDDYQEVEDSLMKAKPSSNVAAEEEVVFETKTVEPVEKEVPATPEEVDPMNTPISKLLRDRTEERKRKMKDFNYKFRNSGSKIDDIEKQPAYKRMGIELDESDTDPNISRTSVNLDDDDLDLRSNNSFLHDNVD